MKREEVFDEDYLYFYETFLTDDVSDRQAELLWSLMELEPGTEVLDLACGHGRIANRLAARGARVVGLDATPLFLERARADADARSLEVEYVEGDMRELPLSGRFDRVLSWFTSFGYFDDDARSFFGGGSPRRSSNATGTSRSTARPSIRRRAERARSW